MNLLRAASLVSLLTLASRVTGLVREQAIAAAFGASVVTDAFNVAFRIPNLLRRLFAEGAFSQAFVPLLAHSRAQEGDAATRALVDAVATVLLWALAATCVAGVVAAPVLVWLMAQGLQASGGFELAVGLTRWMFPYIGFMSLVALSAGVLNTWKRFAVPAATPVLLNLAVIVCAWLLAPRLEARGIAPVYALAVGVMLGGVLQLAVQLPALARIGMLPRFGLGWRAVRSAVGHPGVKRVLKQMAPALLGVSVAQISLLINTQIATQIGPGAVSWLSYADRLMEFPTALLGVALGVVLLPQLAASRAADDGARYANLLDWGLRLVLLFTLPCAVALIVFPQALVAVLYHRGAFEAADVAQTVIALQGYGAGLLGLVALKVVTPGYYAKQDIRTPVKVAVAVLVLTQLLNLLFVPWLGHAGLALSIGCGALVNALWLLIGLHRSASWRPAAGWPWFIAKVVVASTAMGVGLAWAARRFDWVALGAHEGQRAALLAAVLAGSALVYFGVLLAFGVRPRDFVRRG
ncbi:MAG TPA: murein biosynthesis integral membrane protein MurJ [Methylibium sp.]|uniref:murein biosynthesis integral membrane protein MurJ n=1 Tax=Methylibium sp. TaxID=2067992 RepID=UPI002DBC740C|nr:murein biosynthesis integral membrane protein MurJ [Methylibium sp.]HEU4459354.1 murein biosynthesis integral membrane protein MurJ [Methylibium sp.]